jgi:ornithine cyclodeaminase/alanine dehydrogenase-like protein (mu-crystallin family)
MEEQAPQGNTMNTRPMPLHPPESATLDTLEMQVLRTAKEPCITLDDATVHRLLTAAPQDYFRHMHERLREIAAGRIAVEMPPKQVFADPGETSDFRVMPCVTRAGKRITKTLKVVGTNTAQIVVPDQITVGKALIIDPLENYVTHVVDACLLSSARTGLCAALAIHLLATATRRLHIIGSGRVGYYVGFYAATLCGVEEITFADRDMARANTAAAALAARIAGLNCSAVASGDLPGADVVALATTSTTPVCAPNETRASLVISLGADIDHQTELDPAWANAADIYVDTLDTIRFGDLKAWMAAGLLDAATISDFDALLSGKKTQPEPDRRRLFVSTGSALFDNLTLEYLLQQITPLRK